jgi:hypothetical protein
MDQIRRDRPGSLGTSCIAALFAVWPQRERHELERAETIRRARRCLDRGRRRRASTRHGDRALSTTVQIRTPYGAVSLKAAPGGVIGSCAVSLDLDDLSRPEPT